MSETSKTTLTMPTDRELVFTRVFDAPREVVFGAWTDPKQIARWWGPRGFTTTSLDMDVRPGGAWRLVMRGPDGKEYNNRIEYREVVRPERLVYKHAGQDGEHQVRFDVTVTFEELRGKTRLTMRMLFASAGERDGVVKKYGADKGAVQTLERLGEHLATMARTKGDSDKPFGERKVLITRVFDAPRAVVFRAWTDPKQMAKWWGPKGFTNPVCELDVRPGGAIRVVMRAPDGAEHPMGGAFSEVVPPERLVFTAIAEDAAGNPLLEALTIVTFTEVGGKTRLTLDATGVPLVAGAVPMVGGMEAGWTQSIERLTALVSELAVR